MTHSVEPLLKNLHRVQQIVSFLFLADLTYGKSIIFFPMSKAVCSHYILHVPPYMHNGYTTQRYIEAESSTN